MYDNRPSRENRRNRVIAVAVLSVVSLGGVTGGIIATAHHGLWDVDQWTAFGAMFTAVEALGVVGALFFASIQVRDHRETERQRRVDERLDRLSIACYDDLQPSVDGVNAAWSDYLTGLYVAQRMAEKGSMGVDSDDATRLLTNADQRGRSQVTDAHDRLSRALGGAERALRRLDSADTPTYIALRAESRRHSPTLPLFEKAGDLDNRSYEELRGRMSDFRDFVDGLLEQNAPRVVGTARSTDRDH